MEITGIAMLIVLGLGLIATGLPAWIVLIGVACVFSAAGVSAGIIPWPLLGAIPSRLLGLLDSDLLQALPLYVLMGSLLNHLPLGRILFRVGSTMLRRTGAGAPLSAIGLGALLAPLNGSVGASVSMLGRTLQPQLASSGIPIARSTALVCVASTFGVVIPPSLVLILLGDAMMRAHTEALNVTHEAVRIVNTQDIFVGALVPAGLLLLLGSLITWRASTRATAATGASQRPTLTEWITAAATTLLILTLLGGVALGYLYAVEAAAAGGMALLVYGCVTRALTRSELRAVLQETMAITGALFALLVAATVFTLVLRAYGIDRWLVGALGTLAGDRGRTWPLLAAVLAIVALCALVLDAFEMIFVVIPIVMPPLLTAVHDVTWTAVLTLLILQTSFLTPPFGYAVMMVRSSLRRPVSIRSLSAALLPYLLAQCMVFALVASVPSLVWHRNPGTLVDTPPVGDQTEQQGRDMLERQLNEQELLLPEGSPTGNGADR